MSLRRFSLLLFAGLSLVVILIFVWFHGSRVEPVFHSTEERVARSVALNLRRAFVRQHDTMLVRLRSMARWAFDSDYLALEGDAKREWERRRFGAAQPAGRSFDLIFFMDAHGSVRYSGILNRETGRHEYASSSVILRVRAQIPSLFADLETEIFGFSRLHDQPAMIAAAPVRENSDDSFLGRVIGVEYLDQDKLERIVGPVEGDLAVIRADDDPRAVRWAEQVDAEDVTVSFEANDEYLAVFMPRGLDGDRSFAIRLLGVNEISRVSRGTFRLLLALMIGFLFVFGASLAGFLALAVEGPARRLRLAAVRARGAGSERRSIPEEKIAPFHGLGMAVGHLAADLDLVDRERQRLVEEKEVNDRILGLLENSVASYLSGDPKTLSGIVEAVACFPEADLVFFYGLTPGGAMRTCGFRHAAGGGSINRVDLRGEPVAWVERLAREESFRLFSLDADIPGEYDMVAGMMRDYNLAKLLCLPLAGAEVGSGVLLIGGVSRQYRPPQEVDRFAFGLVGGLMLARAASEERKQPAP